MDTQQVTDHGWISQDEVLAVNEKLGLPPGPVNVTVQAVLHSEREDTRKVLEAIWAERKVRGLKARTKEQIEAEIELRLRNESEEEILEVEQLNENAHRTGRTIS